MEEFLIKYIYKKVINNIKKTDSEVATLFFDLVRNLEIKIEK